LVLKLKKGFLRRHTRSSGRWLLEHSNMSSAVTEKLARSYRA
jgi:hypothetical protein